MMDSMAPSPIGLPAWRKGARVLSRSLLCLLACLPACLLTMLPPSAHGTTGRTDLMLAARFDDNASRSTDRDETASALAWLLSATHRRPARLLGAWRIDPSLGIGIRVLPEYDDLDRLRAGIGLGATRNLGRGFSAPWIRVDADLGGVLHRDADGRDGAQLALALVTGSHLTDRLDALAGLVWSERAGDGRVWDTRRQRVFARGELRLPAGTLLWAAVDASRGDVVANGSPSQGLLRASAARTDDAAFGRPRARAPAPPGTGGQRISYRIDATRIGVGAGLIVPLGSTGSLELDAGRGWIEADGDLDYRTTRIALTLLRRLD